MKNKLAFVLSGGGSHGALQVGALYALLENGFQPDLFIGSSIGAVNSTFIAVNRFNKPGLDSLAAAWRDVVHLDLLPANYVWLTMRALFRNSLPDPSTRIRDFFISSGLSSELTFSTLQQPALIIVSSDLNTGEPVLHGEAQDEKVLDVLLLSTALPPWFMPVKKQNRYLVDGAFLSNLPVEPALRMGATEIVALDLLDNRSTSGSGDGVVGFLDKVTLAVEKRQTDIELELAKARGVPILHMPLIPQSPIPFWDFQHTNELLEQGYELAIQTIRSWQSQQKADRNRNINDLPEAFLQVLD